jgi:hypothetical protein
MRMVMEEYRLMVKWWLTWKSKKLNDKSALVPRHIPRDPHEVKVRVNLWLAVYRQSVRLRAEPLETHGQNLFSQLNTWGYSPFITSSLTRGWVCHLQLPLALASAFILGSQSRGTRDHILLSQIREFSFCRLLRLTRLRWRHSTPPPHGIVLTWSHSCHD